MTTVDPPPAERPAHRGSEGDRRVGQGEERCDGAIPLTFPRDGCVRSLGVGRALRARLNASRDDRRSAARGAAGPPRILGDRRVGQGEERSDGALDLTFPRDRCVRSLGVGRALRARLNASRDDCRSAARGAAGPPRILGWPGLQPKNHRTKELELSDRAGSA